jgi:hypothetical protein
MILHPIFERIPFSHHLIYHWPVQITLMSSFWSYSRSTFNNLQIQLSTSSEIILYEIFNNGLLLKAYRMMYLTIAPLFACFQVHLKVAKVEHFILSLIESFYICCCTKIEHVFDQIGAWENPFLVRLNNLSMWWTERVLQKLNVLPRVVRSIIPRTDSLSFSLVLFFIYILLPSIKTEEKQLQRRLRT